MMNKRGPWFVLAAGLMLGALTAYPEGEPANSPASRRPPITSHQRHFIVTGMPGRDALEIAVWAEKVKGGLEDLLGERAPARQVYPLIISAEQREDTSRGWVQTLQQVTGDGNLRQELVMVNPAVIDQEDALEFLCRLLLDRWTVSRMKLADGNSVPEMPAWLAVGLAQQLYPELRSRNRREIQKLARTGKQVPEASAIFDWWHFPSGRWPEKYLAGLLLEWMNEFVPPRKLVAFLADRRAAGTPWDAAAIAALGGYASARDFNMAFDVWLARQKNRLVPGAYSDDLSGIELILAPSSGDLGLIWPDGPGPALTPALLAARRDESWVQQVAAAMRVRLGLALASQPAELARALNGHLEFLAEVASGSRRRSDAELVAMWLAADQRFAEFKRNRTAMQDMMNAVGLPSVQVEPGDRAGLEDMLDRIEAEQQSEP